MTKRLIVYDLDGTLVDTSEDITEAVNHMLTRLSARPLARPQIRAMVGRGLHDLVQRCLASDDEALIRRGMEAFGAYYAAHLDDHSRLYPGAAAVLDYFRPRAQAVLTNKPQPFARDLLVRLGVAGHFVEVITPSAAGLKKPDPTALLGLMDRLGLRRQDVLLIGDSLIDWETSRNAGVEALLLTHGFEDHEALRQAAPGALARDFEAVLAMVQERQW